ncbi:MAG: LysR family transcriptional regulator ArgP [Formivibrio sp.]|nr:LysR family transcriptional regulator ArgP [Formivibrio sp.]
MKIDNAQLAAFAMVIRTGSFEAAARQLHVTPSAVSQRIKQLEDRLGQVLIQRTTPCQASLAGKTLLRYTEQLSLLEDEMLGDLGAFREAGNRHLRVPIAVNADSLDSWFLAVIDQIQPDPLVIFDIRMEDQDHSAVLLREGTVMAAISASAIPIQGCSVEPLGTMRYLAMASPGFVAKYFSTGVNSDSLGIAPMLVFNLKDGLQQAFVSQFSDQPLQPPTHFIPSTHGFVEVAKRGVAWLGE